jgi:hypothetical protein
MAVVFKQLEGKEALHVQLEEAIWHIIEELLNIGASHMIRTLAQHQLNIKQYSNSVSRAAHLKGVCRLLNHLRLCTTTLKGLLYKVPFEAKEAHQLLKYLTAVD